MRIFRICTLFIEGLGKHVKASKNCGFFSKCFANRLPGRRIDYTDLESSQFVHIFYPPCLTCLTWPIFGDSGHLRVEPSKRLIYFTEIIPFSCTRLRTRKVHAVLLSQATRLPIGRTDCREDGRFQPSRRFKNKEGLLCHCLMWVISGEPDLLSRRRVVPNRQHAWYNSVLVHTL